MGVHIKCLQKFWWNFQIFVYNIFYFDNLLDYRRKTRFANLQDQIWILVFQSGFDENSDVISRYNERKVLLRYFTNCSQRNQFLGVKFLSLKVSSYEKSEEIDDQDIQNFVFWYFTQFSEESQFCLLQRYNLKLGGQIRFWWRSEEMSGFSEPEVQSCSFTRFSPEYYGSHLNFGRPSNSDEESDEIF